MAESLGTRLRQQRERQKIALASIAEQTKISLSLLEGLERDDLLRWPTGIFRRAFVRAYAHAIGLDPDSVVREFLELHPDPVEDAATAASTPPSTGEEPVPQGPPTRLRWLIDRAIGSLPRRRLQLNLTSQESILEIATPIDSDSAKATSPPEPDPAAAGPLSTLTAIERATALTSEAVKPASKPRAELAAAAHLLRGTATERATALTSEAVKPASKPRAELAAAAHLSTGIATERTTTLTSEAVKPVSKPRAELAAAAHLSTGTVTERATALTSEAMKPVSRRRANLAAAAHLPTGAATERGTALTRDAAKPASKPLMDLAAPSHLSTEAATERVTAGTNDSVKAALRPEFAPAARLSSENGLERASDSPNAASPREPDLAAAAHLCTELGRVMETRDVPPLLEGAAKILNAIGLIVWVWDPQRTALRPALAHGYPEDVLAQLPGVRLDADNATATAFRSAETRIVNGSDLASGAVVVPLMTPGGCGGVLAVELKHGREQNESVRALAMIFAAQLATLVGFVPLAEAVNA